MPSLPNFIYIGAAKAGSTWIYSALRGHPQVFVPITKRTFFFDRNYAHGLEWYLQHFEPSAAQVAVGEICHDYFLSAEVADRIARDLPDAKLICCLRDPVDRLVSAYLHEREHGSANAASFDQFVTDEENLRKSDYIANLSPFLERFPRERLLVLLYDDLCEDPAAFYRRICEFLGIDAHWEPDMLRRRVNATRRVRFPSIARWVYRKARSRSHADHAATLQNRLRFALMTRLSRLLYSNRKPHVSIDADTRRRLRQRFGEGLSMLESALGLRLPETWWTD